MNDKYCKFALYQKWPGKINKQFNVIDITAPTLAITLYAANTSGLQEAIDNATRADAKLIRIDEPFYDDRKLQKHIEGKILAKKFISVFQPTRKMP